MICHNQSNRVQVIVDFDLAWKRGEFVPWRMHENGMTASEDVECNFNA